MIVVSDSTIFIGLAKIRKLNLLQNLFKEIYIPDTVFKEVVNQGKQRAGAKELVESPWIIQKPVIDYTQVNLLLTSLERGEAEALVLAKEMQAEIILLDEAKARKSAVLAGFNVIGLLGVLIIAKQMGLIKAIKPYLEELQAQNFRLSDKVVKTALHKAEE